MKTENFSKASVLLVAAAPVAFLLLLFIPPRQSLLEAVGVPDSGTLVEATLIQSQPHSAPDGSVIYEHIVTTFCVPAEDPVALALEEMMESISCRRRTRLPFESVTVYKTGCDSLTISLVSGGLPQELVMLSGNNTIVDVGGQRYSYKVDKKTFAQLADMVLTYGTVRSD